MSNNGIHAPRASNLAMCGGGQGRSGSHQIEICFLCEADQTSRRQEPRHELVHLRLDFLG